jgi:hypothetical protein
VAPDSIHTEPSVPCAVAAFDTRNRRVGREHGHRIVTVMTWNVENFFSTPAQQPAYDAKVAAPAGVITAAAPDLVAVQVVGGEQSFEGLRAALGPGWSGVLSASAVDVGRLRWLFRRFLET